MNPRPILRVLISAAVLSGPIWSPIPGANGSGIGPAAYHLTRLGPLQGNRLNNLGDVIGTAAPADDRFGGAYAAIYRSYGERAGAVTPILGPERKGTSGLLLNDRGQAVIQDFNSSGDPIGPSTLFWDGSEVRRIEPEGQQGVFQPLAMNNAGTVVGMYLSDDFEPRAGLWTDGRITPLADGPQPGDPNSAAINDRGQVALSMYRYVSDPWGGHSSHRAVLWEDGEEVDLGTLGGGFAASTDINNAGQVVGVSEGSDGGWHAFRWQDGTMTALEVPGLRETQAEAINASGDILGIGYDDDYRRVPFIIADGSTFLLDDLLPAEFDLQDVVFSDFNDLGQILGYGYQGLWEYESFLLTPASLDAPAPIALPPTSNVPEPTTVAMFCLIGAPALARGAWRRAKGRLHRRGAWAG